MGQNRRSVLIWTLIPGAFLLLAAACAADRPPSGSAWAGEMQHLPNGAVLVTNPEAGIWSHEDGWRVLETLRIGQLDGDGPEVFGRIDAFTIDAAGRIYVLDGQAHEIRTFDADGKFLRRFGRRGGGPGELAAAIGMRQAQDGTLWVVDPGNARYLGLTERDTLMLRRPTPLYDLPWVGGFTADGDFLYDGPVHVANADPRAQYILRIDAASSAVDTIPIPTPDLPRPSLGGIALPLPYAPTALRVFDEAGRYLGEIDLPFEVWEPVLVRENQMYAVVEGEVGEPVLVRARIDQRY